MLLKVESYHDNTASLATTIYPCLATSSSSSISSSSDEEENGILVSGGRKVGDLTFLQDKSVSRQHFVLRCLGTHKGMTNPRTKEEKAVCEESELNMCVVFESSGKGGSFVCSSSPEPIPDNKKEEYDDDSETDDEGVSQQPSANAKNTNTMATSNAGVGDIPPISATTRNHFGNVPVTLKKIDVGDTVVLPLETSADPILIQLGRFESTIKISWVPLRVMFSNMKRNKFEKTLEPKLYTIGGMRVEDTGKPTHLVTEELNAGGKQIIAWAKELPMIQSSWLDQMLARKSPSDPLPNPKDHPITKNADSSIKFWNKKPNRELLQDFTLLSVEQGSFEVLAVAGGVQLVKLHQLASEDKQLELAQQALQKKDTVVFIAKTRRRITKKLAALDIPQVELKELARSITNRKNHLGDTNGNTLSHDTTKQQQQQESSAGSALTSTTTSVRSTRRTRRAATQETPKAAEEDDDDHEEETPPTTTPYETQCLLEPKRMDIDEEQEDAPDKNTESEGDKLGRIPEQSMETEPSMLTEPSALHQQEPESLEESPPPKPTKKTTKRQQNNNSAADNNNNCKLKKADSNGWFSAAPSDDSVRQQWRKTYEKYHRDDDYLDFDVTVATESMQVVIPNDKSNDDSHWRIPPGRKRKGVKDFRKFRKNRIIKSDPRITIRFSKVGSQATDDQSKSFDNQERELAEEQKLADALFRNDGFGGGRKRRRRVA